MNYKQEREQLCKICHLLFERKLVAGSDGNISMRLDGNKMLITPSGKCKGFLEPEMLLVQDFELNVIEGNLRSTKEAKLHSSYYTLREDVGAIIHTHPPYTTAFCACGQEIPLDVLIEVPVLIGKAALAAYAPPGSLALVEEAKKHMQSDVILLENHGVIVASGSIDDAFIKMDALENAAHTIINSLALGGIRRIAPDEVLNMLK